MEDWLINYYEQTDPHKRQQMLLENKNETMSEEDKLRMKLWETRYGKGKPRKDMFVGYLMNLKYIVESGSMDLGGRKKKLAIEAILGLNLYEFERKPKTQQEIIFLELKNTCRKYIEISTDVYKRQARAVLHRFPSCTSNKFLLFSCGGTHFGQ